jgi:hypothetical protein
VEAARARLLGAGRGASDWPMDGTAMTSPGYCHPRGRGHSVGMNIEPTPTPPTSEPRSLARRADWAEGPAPRLAFEAELHDEVTRLRSALLRYAPHVCNDLAIRDNAPGAS